MSALPLRFLVQSEHHLMVEWTLKYDDRWTRRDGRSGDFFLPAPQQDTRVYMKAYNNQRGICVYIVAVDLLAIDDQPTGVYVHDLLQDLQCRLQLVRGGEPMFDCDLKAYGDHQAPGGGDLACYFFGHIDWISDNVDRYRDADQSVTFRFTAVDAQFRPEVMPTLAARAAMAAGRALTIDNVFEVLSLARRFKRQELQYSAMAFLFDHRKQLVGSEQFKQLLNDEWLDEKLLKRLTIDLDV